MSVSVNHVVTVKCGHAASAVETIQARDYGLMCKDEGRRLRMSMVSAYLWLNRYHDKLTERGQDMVRCGLSDLQRQFNIKPWSCAAPVEVEPCDKSVNCGVIQLGDIEPEENCRFSRHTLKDIEQC